MDTKFTNGEWRFTISKNGVRQISSSLFGNICKMWGNKETVANAHLIAAAPDMYKFIDSLIGNGLVYGEDVDKAMELLQSARGE